ncbi:transposase [Xenorhabdus ishibashii]|uniref:Transposase n=2 Tax=Xenorhabdus ishibashii TaxID=1034471 RepID=A0A2D0KDB5_9GAMM|nr:transposase [Xenorhabdus ishibashii]
MKLKPTKRHYSVEFKLEAVQQVVLHHQRVIDIARSLAVDASTLRKWIRQYKAEIQGVTPAGKALTPEQRQIQALEKQVRRLEVEKEILKQAAVLMSEIRSGAKTEGAILTKRV